MITKKRYNLIDIIRGITIVSMVVYHACWDLAYISHFEMSWFRTDAVFLWQQSICWTFIMLSGFCWTYSVQKSKRGCIVLGASILVTAVTVLFTPESRIVFGVLNAIGTSMILMIPLDKVCCKINAVAGAISSFALFCLTRGINGGTLFFGTVQLPEEWYCNLLTAYLGMPPESFFSTDYFPVVPWMFLFITGYFVNRAIIDKSVLECRALPVLELIGRHSLLIYLMHQPVLYLIIQLP